MKRIFALFFAMLLLMLPMGAMAANVVDYTADFYVADYANVLDDQTEGLIVLNNDLLDKACGAQIVVVTVGEVSSVASIENYAYTLFNQWGIGDKAKNNGLLILIAVNEGTYWMMPGKGLQDYMNAGDLDAMAAEHFIPSASLGNFDEAVRQLFGACFDKVCIAYNVKLSVDDSLYYKWIQKGQQSSDGSRFLSAPLKSKQESTPAQVQTTPTEKPSYSAPVKKKNNSSFMPILIILVIIAAVFGISKMRKNAPVKHSTPPPPPSPAPRPTVNPYRTPTRTTRPPMSGAPRPPMNGIRPPMNGTRPPMSSTSRPPMSGTSRPPMSGTSRPPMSGTSRPPMSGTSRPPMSGTSRPPMSGTSRPSAPRTGGGGMTRGGGSGGSFGSARPSGGSLPRSSGGSFGSARPSGGSVSRPSGGGFGGGRSGGGGGTRGGGSGGSFR